MVAERRFSWKKLPEGLRSFLAQQAGIKKNANDALWVAAFGDEPSTDVLQKSWIGMRDEWLRNDLPNARPLSKALMSRGLGNSGLYGRSRAEVDAYLRSCRFSPTLAEELLLLLWEIAGVRTRWPRPPGDGEVNGTYQGRYTFVPPEGTITNPFRPYEHQTEAWAALDKVMNTPGKIRAKRGLRGLLVLPTGGGKTSTVTHWLGSRYLKEKKARPVLWVAHRAELLEQAAWSFAQHVEAAGRDRDRPLIVQCMSSRHGKGADQLLVEDVDVYCASIFTLVAGANELIVEKFLERNPNTFIVIDEAHHAPAHSYRWLLNLAGRFKGVDVLGLTATPTRTAERERGWIGSLFRDGIIYEANLTTLISKGILARPLNYECETKESVKLSPVEKRYLDQFHEYPPSVLERLANSMSRNAAIVDYYLKTPERFGQTLVFAANVAHAVTLADRFNGAGVKADYVTHVAEPDHPSAASLLADFRAGRLQVLTSVTKLTEGIDLPNVSSVFLARPTRSEVLLKQMVGRALRGPDAGGTEVAHLVSFSDHWQQYGDWMSPRDLFPGTDIEVPGGPPRPPSKTGPVPWELYRELARQSPQLPLDDALELVPAGWYDLTAFEGEEDDRPLAHLPVYDHQRDGFQKLIEIALQGEKVGGDPLEACFSATIDPRPSAASVDAVTRYIEELGTAPLFVEFADRETYLPRLVAQRFIDEGGANDLDYAIRIWESTAARDVYPDRGLYVRNVRRHVENIELDGHGLDDWVPVDLTRELRKPLEPGQWDLQELLAQVRAEMFLSAPSPTIGWSERILRSYWGQYNPRTRHITINRILQTRSISRDSMKLLVYHEALHHELPTGTGHGGEFRARERLFPNKPELNAELDSLEDRFRLDREPEASR